MRLLFLVVFTAILLPASLSAQGVPGSYTGNGTLSVTTSSALINTMTVATGSALPAAWANLTVRIPGSAGNVALCPRGGTCTCPQNTVAVTNGATVPLTGSWSFVLPGIAAATPSIVACTATVTVELLW